MAQTSAAKNAAQNKSANGIDPRRQAALDTALAQVEKSFGKGSAMRLGDRPEQDVEVIPTGSLALDMALGIGGLPKGRIVEIYGPESSGKTTLALHVVANAQKAGGVAAFIDAEHALDHALDPVASAAASMSMLAVSEQEAADLRFGRRIAHDIRTTTAAYVEETNDLVAILERAKRGEAKPVAVFN